MIERFIKSELALKRWRKFKSNRRAYASLWVVFIISVLSFSAEFWSNSKPLIMSHKGQIYFPVIKQYHPTEFGIEDELVVDYRQLQVEGWVLWPINRWDPSESNKSVQHYPSEPSAENWLGTDDRGRDIFSRLLYGYRYSFTYAISVWFLSFAAGIVLGGVMGYLGGRVDLAGQRLVEVFSTVPQFFLLIIVISIFQPNIYWLIFLSAIFGWIFISYYVRAEFLKHRKREFVEAARALGANHSRMIFKHILPNSLGPVITYSPFVIASNVAALASLDFLGFGLPQPTPSWGELLNQSQRYVNQSWWLALYPSLALFLALVLFGMIGEALRE